METKERFQHLSLFDIMDEEVESEKEKYISECPDMTSVSNEELFKFYDELNNEVYHKESRDDECTPMLCVKTMLDYIPSNFWEKKNIKIFDPCCGNGNFGAYAKTLTSIDNIWFNDLNKIRIENCKKILNPKNLFNEDAFFLCKTLNMKWDLIMANPPYSGGGNKNMSLSNQFIEMGVDFLNDGGYLCFITPNNWMTYNNDNTTLKKLLCRGSFIVIDNNVKKYFPKIGSSFTVFVWQKGVFNNKTLVYNNFLLKDVQENVEIPSTLPFIPLYISQTIIDIVPKVVLSERNAFDYRCDLHNFTKKSCLSDNQSTEFPFETIHTARKTRYASFKQDIYDKWIIIVPLSTYYIPYIVHNKNVTQSVGYIPFDNEVDAEQGLMQITKPIFKVIVHITRYGNFNNIKVLRHLAFTKKISLTSREEEEISKLLSLIKY